MAKPVKTKLFIRFLKSRGLVLHRTEGDHEIWDMESGPKLSRPVVFISCEKEVPPMHLSTNLRTLGMTYNDFVKAIAKL